MAALVARRMAGSSPAMTRKCGLLTRKSRPGYRPCLSDRHIETGGQGERMRHFLRSALIAMVASLCAGAASAETIARVGVAARDLGALDPAYGIGNGDEFTIRQIYNTLVSPPDGTTKIQVDQLQGELAETWEV